jgi:hypothetical protein
MKTTRPDSTSPWEALLKKAQADKAPSTDLQALLRAVSTEPRASESGWWSAFLALFPVPRFLSAGLVGAACLALFSLWQALDLWQTLPWAQLLATSVGGAP